MAAAAINAAAGTLFSWSVLLPDLATDLHTTSRVVASAFSTALAVFAITVVAAGRAVDRYGPRRTSALAGALSGTGLTLTALAQDLVLLHVGFGVIFGLGNGLAYSSTVTWASTRPGAGSARSVAVVVAAYAAGPIVAGPVGELSTAQWGWRSTVLLGAAVVSTVTILASRVLPDSDGARDTPPPAGSDNDRPMLAALWLLFLSASAPALFAFAYAADLAGDRGLPSQLGGLAVASMGMGNLVGRILAGALADRLGLRQAMRADLALMIVALTALAWLPGGAAAVLALLLLAVQYGALSSLLPIAVREACESSRFGSAYGMVFSAWGLAGLLAPRLPDPASPYASALPSWVPLMAAAIIGLVAYERRLSQR